jgi:GNAT superfamily N-acetyltransferase
MHALAVRISDAADGRFPAIDGGWSRVPMWRGGVEAVVAFTGHAVFAVADDIPDAMLVGLGADGFGGAHHPRLVSSLAGAGSWIDSLDALLVMRSTGGVRSLVARPDLAGLPRVAHAAGVRDVQQVLGPSDPDDASVVVVAKGIAGLTEISFELDPRHRQQGRGEALVRAALAELPGETVLAAVAPGNAASLRSVLAAGFVPIGSVQLFRRGTGLDSP